MKLKEISAIIKTSFEEAMDKEIKELITDSRKVLHPQDALFIALKGKNRDGHLFIKDAYDKGIRSFLVQEPIDQLLYPDAQFLKVNNTQTALQQIAIAQRNHFHYPVIGITGSNGKTIVKEWLFQILSSAYNIIRSPKSFNSQIGVPLSVWKMSAQENLAIFEAGISQPGEMTQLEKIIRPDIGIFTHIGDAHSEGFLSNTQKIREKLMLFNHAKALIYCKDEPELNEQVVAYRHQIKNTEEDDLNLFTWSYKTAATLRILKQVIEQHTCKIQALYQEETIEITIPFSDAASIENAIHCWCTALLLGLPQAVIQQQMAMLSPVAMRLEVVQGIHNCLLINDTYNSDLSSLHIALDFLAQQKQHSRKTLILSDMLQISKPDAELYEEVAASAAQKNIQRIIGIGPNISKHKNIFRAHKNIRSIFFKSTEAFLKKIHLLTFQQEAILLKGARTFKFENIEKLLEQKLHNTVLEINLSAITNNINVYRSLLPPQVKMMAMVKAFSYGSGSVDIANLLQFMGLDYLAVAYVDEGVTLRRAGITLPIMVMSPNPDAFGRMIFWKLEPEIFNLNALSHFENITKALGVSDYPIHLKLDTGMHRLGFVEDEIAALKQRLIESPYVKVVSIFSHLAGAEDSQLDDYTHDQIRLFKSMSSDLLRILKEKPLLHILNSGGIVRHGEMAHFDMVRLGIGMYGIDSSAQIQNQLQAVGTLKTRIAQLKSLPQGATVGYSRRGVLTRNSLIATVNIGYADGYFRDFGNGNAYMLVRNQKAPLIGSVCMDMCMLDVTDVEGVQEGDEVIVFGKDLTVNQLADWSHTIPYEIMTSISQRVNRVYVND